MFGDAEAVIDRRITTRRIKAGRSTQFARRNHCYRFEEFGAVLCIRNKLCPVAVFVPVAAFLDEAEIGKSLSDDDMRHRRQHRDIGAGA